MLDGWLEEGDVAALARQAVELLDNEATVRIKPGPAESATVPGTPAYWLKDGQAGLPNLPRVWDIQIKINDSRATARLDASWEPALAVANLILDLQALCGGSFRGRWFPECPGHDHSGLVTEANSEVVFRCPINQAVVGTLKPELTYNR